MATPVCVSERQMTRREAIGRSVRASVGIAAALTGAGTPARLEAQIPVATSPPPDAKFPQAPSWKTELRELAPNVFAYVQGGGPGQANQGVSNGGFVVGDDHLLAIDAYGAPFHTKAFLKAAAQASNKPFRRLINTHHHGDHVNGNQFFPPVEIISHPYCREEVLKTVATTPAKWDKRDGWADGTEDRKVVVPSTTFEGKTVYRYGNTAVEVEFLGPAHTYGDLIVYIPQYKILFASDIAFYYVAPFAHNAHVGKWLETIDKIMKMDVDTIVPGHGPIGGKKELAEMADYFKMLQPEARKRYDAGMSPGRAAAEIKLGRFDNWIGPERIVMNTVRLYNEFKGTGGPNMDLEGTRRATDEYNAILARSTNR
jgi:glyoxylase-like metal-dependent hydrolase (beta-lactamase superfamily II)